MVKENRHIITVTGPDRSGLVAGITSVLANFGIDLEDVTMTRLSGNFAMIILVHSDINDEVRDALFQRASELNLVMNIDHAVENAEMDQANCFISVAGINKVGILHKVSDVLKKQQVNILELTTKLLSATEVPVYIVRIEGYFPGANIADLRNSFRELSDQMQLEITVESLESDSL